MTARRGMMNLSIIYRLFGLIYRFYLALINSPFG